MFFFDALKKWQALIFHDSKKLFSFCSGVICLFDLIFYIPSTIFQLCGDGSSWAEPVLS